MAKEVKISPKHGLNPTIPICFFCGKEKNEIAILGKLKDDKEAPMHAIIDYEPCEHCKEQMDMGITLIGVTDKHNGCPEIQKGLYPTGQWMVISERGFNAVFSSMDSETKERILKLRKAFVEDEVIKVIETNATKE